MLIAFTARQIAASATAVTPRVAVAAVMATKQAGTSVTSDKPFTIERLLQLEGRDVTQPVPEAIVDAEQQVAD